MTNDLIEYAKAWLEDHAGDSASLVAALVDEIQRVNKLHSEAEAQIACRSEMISRIAQLMTEVATLRARNAELTTWRPLADAPRDRTDILLLDIDDSIVIGWWEEHENGAAYWMVSGDPERPSIIPPFRPKGWLPLPEPPSPDQ